MKKITGEMIVDKLKELPESDQQTILDFIDYLLEKQEQKQDKKSVAKKKAWLLRHQFHNVMNSIT